jgi:hypothetical protein
VFDAPLDEPIAAYHELVADESGDEIDGRERLGLSLQQPGF